MEAIINVTELACELAHNELKEKFTIDGDFKLTKVYKYVNGGVQYTDEAQDIFNELNDKWEEIIMLSEVKIPSATVRWYKADIESLGYQCTDEQAEEAAREAQLPLRPLQRSSVWTKRRQPSKPTLQRWAWRLRKMPLSCMGPAAPTKDGLKQSFAPRRGAA